MLNFGSTIATRLTLVLLLQFAALTAMAGDTCDGDLSNWPSELEYLPSLEEHEGAVLQLGSKTKSKLVTSSDSVVVTGKVITVSGYWDDACGFFSIPWTYSVVDLPNLSSGVYTVNFQIFGLPSPQRTRTLVVGGSASERHIVPAVSDYSLAAGILAVLGLVGWQLRRDRLRAQQQGG